MQLLNFIDQDLGQNTIVKIVLSVCRVPFPELLKYSYFNLAGVSVLWDGSNDLDSHTGIIFGVNGLDNLAKGALAQQPNGTIYQVIVRNVEHQPENGGAYSVDGSYHRVQ